MASPIALVPWKEVVFFALLLLAFNVSARELVGTRIVARTVRKSPLFNNTHLPMLFSLYFLFFSNRWDDNRDKWWDGQEIDCKTVGYLLGRKLFSSSPSSSSSSASSLSLYSSSFSSSFSSSSSTLILQGKNFELFVCFIFNSLC